MTINIVKGYSPTGRKEDIVEDTNAFSRQVVIYSKGKKVFETDLNHPESIIYFTFNKCDYIILPNSNDIYKKINRKATD